MSVPACIWASQTGRDLKLTCPERVTLWQLAERANGKGFCWPSVVQLMADTGLARQTVLIVVHALARLGLIRIEKQGQRHVYHMLRPVQNKTGERSNIRPATGLDLDQNRSKAGPATGLKTAPNRSKSDTDTGLESLPGTYKRNLVKEPSAREAPAASASGREPEKQNSDSGGEGAAPPPSSPTKAPLLGATNGSAPPDNAIRTPGQPDNPFAGADEAKAFMSRTLGRTVPLATPQPDTVTEDDRPQTEADRERMAAQIAKLVESIAGAGPPGVKPRKGALTMRAYPPGERSVFDADQQQDIYRALARPTPKHLAGEQLAAARRIALARCSP